MDLFQVILLSIIQGITEFLPISSSAHLILFSQAIGEEDQGIVFDVAVHFGTLLAAIYYFRDDLFSMFLDIKKNPSLDLFQVRIIEKLNTLRDYDFDPHLSLVYCDKQATKVSIRGVSMPKTIRFESLAVVEVPNNIDEWNIIKEFKFNFSK